MVEPIEFAAERLRLRQWRPHDRPAVAALDADPRVVEWFESPPTRQQSDAMADRRQELIAERGWGFWAVEVRWTSEFVGCVGLRIPSAPLPFQPWLEIGWRLGSSHWHQGLATEAARGALTVGFETLGLDGIVSFAVAGNHRSIAVMERLGKRFDGFFEHPILPDGSPLRRHVLYRFDRVDWGALNAAGAVRQT